jgi:hypothetical protein
MNLGENKSAAMLALENFMRTVSKHRDSFGNLLLAALTHVVSEHGQRVGVSPGQPLACLPGHLSHQPASPPSFPPTGISARWFSRAG